MGIQETPTSDAGLVTVSERAAKRIAEIISRERKPGLKFRVAVAGGGCSGFQYDFSLDESANEDDLVIEKGGAVVVVDQMSLVYLAGSEIDFVEELGGSFFSIRNPNVVASCGCGHSFSVD